VPVWLCVALAVLGCVSTLFAMIRFENGRQTRILKAELAVSLLEHTAECPARASAVEVLDDSGAVQLVDARGEPSARWRR
jgi:hypothetical protein